MASQVHQNDIGTQFVITVLDDGAVVDISTATDLKIYFRKPDSTTLTKTGVLYTDGTDGKMVYTTIAGDLDLVGNYKIQGRVEIDGGTFYTDLGSFKVHCNI
jgi:acyl-CoA-binding protein